MPIKIRLKSYLAKINGFTIIELLVVISIIGLLSSIVLIGVKDSRKLASFTAVKAFSANIKHAIGAYELAEWNFDGNSPNENCVMTDDFTNNKNDGICEDGVFITNNKADVINGNSAFFDGDGAFIQVYDSDSLKSYTNKLTIELWIKGPASGNWIVYSPKFYGYLKNWISPSVSAQVSLDLPLIYKAQSIILAVENSKLIFRLFNDGNVCGLENFEGIKRDVVLDAKEWSHIVATYNGSEIKLYVNAKQLGEVANCNYNIIKNFGHIYIGYNGQAYFKGFMDDIRIYSYGLSETQIKNNYASGLQERIRKNNLISNK